MVPGLPPFLYLRNFWLNGKYLNSKLDLFTAELRTTLTLWLLHNKESLHSRCSFPKTILGPRGSQLGREKISWAKIEAASKVYCNPSTLRIFPDLFLPAPTNCPWVSEEAKARKGTKVEQVRKNQEWREGKTKNGFLFPPLPSPSSPFFLLTPSLVLALFCSPKEGGEVSCSIFLIVKWKGNVCYEG